ncbi:hypothetical protein [Pseudomonas sp.]|uniref:hypothetical protein n=1 Tax=Pseudomonas sp. TaxID=306 RepID=UPI002579D435|nr:hypothetical protein [Pseudomonas sp.]
MSKEIISWPEQPDENQIEIKDAFSEGAVYRIVTSVKTLDFKVRVLWYLNKE